MPKPGTEVSYEVRSKLQLPFQVNFHFPHEANQAADIIYTITYM